MKKIIAEFYPYRWWILFLAMFIVGFFGGIAVGLNSINQLYA